jgi:hypothetical protein
VRSAPRDALIAASVPPEAFGRAFGFHRMGDSLGAVIGPRPSSSRPEWPLSTPPSALAHCA